MSKDTLRQLTNALSVALALTINILASALPLNGQNTGEISDRFDVYFVPAGYVFSIWLVIFISWVAFAIYQFLPAQKENPRLRKLGYWFALSGVFNAAWLFCWHYNLFGLSVLVMLALLGTLIVSYLKLDIGRVKVGIGEIWAVDIPFSIYLGWISVATVANITSWLYSFNWDGFGISAEVWAMIMLGVATLLGFIMTITRYNIAYLIVLIWSFVGIGIKQSDTPQVAYAAWAAAEFSLAVAVISFLYRRAAAKKAQKQ